MSPLRPPLHLLSALSLLSLAGSSALTGCAFEEGDDAISSVGGAVERKAPEEIACLPSSETPLLAAAAVKEGVDIGFAARAVDEDEENGGLSRELVEHAYDVVALGEAAGTKPAGSGRVTYKSAFLSPYTYWLRSDADGDCATNAQELSNGTDLYDPDTDGDGWYDGACNERRRLYVDWVKAHDEQEDVGKDELYFVVDDVRYPHRDLDDYWTFDDGESRTLNRLVAERVRGTNYASGLRVARLEAWEDDVQVTNTWSVDDLLFTMDVDLGAYSDGEEVTLQRTYSDWDYEIRFRVEIDHFADPDPLSDADLDDDGILESGEFAVARDFGGITDPYQQDILVEVDWMPGHWFGTRAKRLVTTQLRRHGYYPYIHRHQQVTMDECLTRDQARALYDTRFSFSGYGAFRYAVMGELLWNDASGVTIGDTFFIDDSTWWINGGTLAQAGTFIHELGHTLGLTREVFHLIDTTAWLSYDCAMNYTFQATMVDYSDDAAGGDANDHDDWALIDPAEGLRYSFGASSTSNDGICD